MAWWYNPFDFSHKKGTTDVGLGEHEDYKNKKSAVKIILTGLLCVFLFLAFNFAIRNPEVTGVLKVFFIIGGIISAISSLQVFIGIYYFIKYFNK